MCNRAWRLDKHGSSSNLCSAALLDIFRIELIVRLCRACLHDLYYLSIHRSPRWSQEDPPTSPRRVPPPTPISVMAIFMAFRAFRAFLAPIRGHCRPPDITAPAAANSRAIFFLSFLARLRASLSIRPGCAGASETHQSSVPVV